LTGLLKNSCFGDHVETASLSAGVGVFFCLIWFITIRESPIRDPVIGTIEKMNFMNSITGKAQSAGARQVSECVLEAIHVAFMHKVVPKVEQVD
jgi:hypothetical protein